MGYDEDDVYHAEDRIYQRLHVTNLERKAKYYHLGQWFSVMATVGFLSLTRPKLGVPFAGLFTSAIGFTEAYYRAVLEKKRYLGE